MRTSQIFPVALIILDIAASMGYIQAHNWRMAIYWAAAATLTASVTF